MSELNQHIEHYESIINSGDYDKACEYFREHLEKQTLLGIGEPCYRRTGLLEQLFPNGTDVDPATQKIDNTIFALQALSHSYNMIGGYPGKAVPLYKLHVQHCREIDDKQALAEGLANFGKGLRQSGHFREAEAMGMTGLSYQREVSNRIKEAINLYWVGMGMAHRGVDDGRPEIAMNRAIRICESLLAERSVAIVNSFLAQHYLWLDQPDTALPYADKAWDSAVALEQSGHDNLNEVVMVLSASSRMQGEVAMRRGDYQLAEERLGYTMERAKDIDFTEEVLPALRVYAEMERRKGNFAQAREYLQRTWTLAERGPFPLYNSDSYNTLAAIELSEGNHEQAYEAACTAYKLAWCDGPPYAYQRGLDDALEIFKQLDRQPPELPALDDSLFSPIPDVDLNPQDEFHS